MILLLIRRYSNVLPYGHQTALQKPHGFWHISHTIQSEKDALTIEIETLNREKKQAETAVKGLQTMCRNLAIQKTQLTTEQTELQSQLSEGKISLDGYNRKKADLEK